MKDIIEFYSLVSPLVAPEKFCIDPSIKLETSQNHPPCTLNSLAGIRRNKWTGNIESFTNNGDDYNCSSNKVYYVILAAIITVLLYSIMRRL